MHSNIQWLISLHIRSMWETICEAWACWSGWKFGPNSTEYPYSEIQNTPQPPPPPRKLKFRHILALCDLSVSEYPPPQLKFRHISALCDFSVSEYPLPPPPENWNLGTSWHILALFSFRIPPPFPPPPPPPPGEFKISQIFPMGNYVWQVTTCGDFIQPG